MIIYSGQENTKKLNYWLLKFIIETKGFLKFSLGYNFEV